MITHRNHSGLPLVSLQIMTHSGDLHLLARAAKSVLAQDLDHSQIEVQVVYDGKINPDQWLIINEAFNGFKDFYRVMFVGGDEKNGYYCVARNRALPDLRGFYVAHMDADNEFAPHHLSGLLAAIRIPHPEQGLPHFVYSRRKYILDEGADDTLVTGPSRLVPWLPENIRHLQASPQGNFVDTGDFLVGKAALYRLSEETGSVWNSELRRFGDWDLVARMANCGFKGMAVDQITNLYHWTGSNLQTTRKYVSDIDFIPLKSYEKLKAKGLIKI